MNIYICIYVIICIHMEYPRLHMAYGILQATYHFSEHRLPKQNCHKFAICSIHTRCICFFNGTNMAGQNLVPQNGWFTIHTSAPGHPCSRGK